MPRTDAEKQRERDLSLIDNLLDAARALRDGWKEEVHGEGYVHTGWNSFEEVVHDMDEWAWFARNVGEAGTGTPTLTAQGRRKMRTLLEQRYLAAMAERGRDSDQISDSLAAAQNLPIDIFQRYVDAAERNTARILATRQNDQSGSSNGRS